MNESYSEWLVKRKPPAYALLVKIVMIILCVVAVFLALTTMFGIIILALAGAATYLLFQSLNLEFEYLYVNGQLTIDKIMGRARRKQVWEGKLEEIQIIAPTDSYVLKDYETSNMKTLDFSSGMPGAKAYAIISQSGANSVKVLFEPNEKMLHCIRQMSPRKVIK